MVANRYGHCPIVDFIYLVMWVGTFHSTPYTLTRSQHLLHCTYMLGGKRMRET